MSAAGSNRMTYAAYLDAEQRSEIKHEYLRGEVYAMAGGTPEHAALAMAVGAALTTAIAGRRCRVFSSDLRVRVASTDLTTYPDITVICGSRRMRSIATRSPLRFDAARTRRGAPRAHAYSASWPRS